MKFKSYQLSFLNRKIRIVQNVFPRKYYQMRPVYMFLSEIYAIDRLDYNSNPLIKKVSPSSPLLEILLDDLNAIVVKKELKMLSNSILTCTIMSFCFLVQTVYILTKQLF